MIVPESAHHISFVGHTDQGRRGDGVQVMVDRGYAYIGTRVSRGVMVTDVRDPRNPKPANFMPTHPNSVCLHLQAAEGLLLNIEELDLRALVDPRHVGGRRRNPALDGPLGAASCGGGGRHRLCVVAGRGPYNFGCVRQVQASVIIASGLMPAVRRRHP